MTTTKLRATYTGIYAGLAVVLAAGLFALVLVTGMDQVRSQRGKPKPLASWSNQRIQAELGEANTLDDCGNFLGEELAGMKIRIWAHEDKRRILFLCTAE